MTFKPLSSGLGGHMPKRLMALAVAAATYLFGLSLAGTASAADAYNAKALERGMKEAPAVVAAAKLPCEIKEAAYIGESSGKEDGKDLKGVTYEVACSNGMGFVLVKLSNGQPGPFYNCNQAEAYNKLKSTISKCRLPGNAVNYTWLTPLVQKASASCDVSKARWMGAIPDTKTTRYEIGCKTGPGGIFDVPDFDNPDQTQVKYRNCLQVVGTQSACQFVTQEQALEAIKPQITKGSASCQVNNFRYMGGSDDSNYYEVGCANQAGFVLVTTRADVYKSTASCDRAGNIGGCKFTDSAAIAADMEKAYTTQLAKGGFTCSVKEYNVIGTQTSTNRDMVEFLCPEQPWGLIGFVPNEGSAGKFDMFDCFAAKARKRECSLTTDAILTAQISVMAKATTEVKKDCVINQVRYIGLNEENNVIVEIACINKRGYLATMNTKRTAFDFAQPCTVAKKYTQKCEIPGNGTFTLP